MYQTRNLFVLLCALGGHTLAAQWPRCEKDPTVVTYSTSANNSIQVVSDEAGGAYFLWYAGDPNQGQFRTHVQRLDEGGLRLWGDAGIEVAPQTANQVIFQSLPDGNGGLFVTWVESRLGTGLTNLYGQHLSAAGQRLWGDSGRYLSEVFDFYRYPFLRLSDGSLMVVHQENPAGAAVFQTYLRKLNADGSLAYDVLLEAQHNTNYPVRFFDDTQGGVFAVWQNDTAKIQHITANGQAWPAPIRVATNTGSLPYVYSCGAGAEGLYVVWCGANQQTQLCDLRFQRFERDGKPAFPGGYLELPIFGFNPDQVVAARNGGFYFQALNAIHRVDAAGNLLWRTELPNNANTLAATSFVETENGALVAAYTNSALLLIAPDGKIAWQKNGLTSATGAHGIAGICRAADGTTISGHINPEGGPNPFTANKWTDDGQRFDVLLDFVGSIAGPDSVEFNTPFLLEAQPIEGVVTGWEYSFDPALGFLAVPDDSTLLDKSFLNVGGIYYDFYTRATVQLGKNCLDTTNVNITRVKPIIPEGDFTQSDDPLILRPTLAGMELFVATAFSQSYQVDVWVTDMSGRVVDFVEFPVDAGNFYGLYPTDSLEHGVYFFTMRVKDKVKNLRFVKLTH